MKLTLEQKRYRKTVVFDNEVKMLQQKIDNLDERDLMYKHYIEFKNWNDVFREMGYSKSAGYRAHQQALSKL